MPAVLLINPNISPETTAMMHRLLRDGLPAAIEVVSATACRGAPMITTEAELAVAVDQVVAIGRARAKEMSAIVIGAFGNPGLEVLRAAVEVPVIGIGEASMRQAAADGRRFGVATTTPGLDASIARAAAGLGLGALFTGTRISPGDPLELASQPRLQDERLAEAVAACIADGAQAVVIGGGPLAEAAVRLGARFDVPVISAVAAAAREIERLLMPGPARYKA
ncbi:MAG: putative Hydantoin racemase [Variovorax sp.]|nr:putative Hydantoin racemase [Variovorax sp.]